MGALRSVIVNTRSLTARLTGVQRYTTELLTHFPLSIDKVSPTTPMQGMQGHLWEQFNLPLLLQRRLLWSPANSGPLIVKNQVVTIHDIAVIDHPEWFNARFAKWYKWITPTLVRRARFVIAVSEFTKRRLMDVAKVDGSRIIVIPNGVNPSFRRRPPDEIAAVRNKLGIPSAQYVLSLGTMEPRKNLAAQMTAWSRCVAELPPDIWLVVCGAIFLKRPATESHALLTPMLDRPFSFSLIVAFGAAMVPVTFSYGGYQTANFIAGEVREPRKNLPRGLMLGVAGVIALYQQLKPVGQLTRDLGARVATSGDEEGQQTYPNSSSPVKRTHRSVCIAKGE